MLIIYFLQQYYNYNKLLNVSLKEYKTAPLQQPDQKVAVKTGAARLEEVNYRIGTMVPPEDSIEYNIISPPPIPEEEKKEDSIDWIMCDLATEAKYPGGNAAWLRYLKKNLRFPKDSIVEKLPLTVMVQFVVDDKGNICEVEAVSGSPALSEEAVRVIRESRKWKPAKKLSNGRGVKSFKKQPIIFRLETEK